jgi:hypothetical protein
MTSVIRLCLTCGAEIPPDAPEGGCPGLLQTGLDPFEQDGHPRSNQYPAGRERSLEILGDWAITSYWKKLAEAVRE